MSSAYVAISSVVYVLLDDREQFDKLEVDPKDHGDLGPKGHVLTKTITGPGSTPGRPIMVCVQHWLRAPDV